MKFSLKKNKVASKGQTENFNFFSLKGRGNSVRKNIVRKVELKHNGLFESDISNHDAKISISTIKDIDKLKSEDPELVIKLIQPRRERLRQRKRKSLEKSFNEHQRTEHGTNDKSEGKERNHNSTSNLRTKRQKPVPLISRNTLDDVSETTEESYAKVPVEKFGLAMLRGMGWKGNVSEIEKKKITKDEESKQRPLLLGLGAKPSSIQLDPSYRFSSANYEPLTKVPKNSGRSSRI